MPATSPLHGVSTVNFFAADHAAAKTWYTEFLGVEPYFERPGYVDDVDVVLQRAVGMGATQLEAPEDRGHGFITATAVDPFGNILGIMYNPHYVEILSTLTTS